MNKEIEQLLKVLKLDEADQDRWCEEHISAYRNTDKSLADLAFQMRDEIIKGNLTYWQRAMDIVFLEVSEDFWKEEHEYTRWTAVLYWFSHVAKPIHFVIAVLIAETGGT